MKFFSFLRTEAVLAALFVCVSAGVSSQSQAQFLPDPILLDSFEGTGGNISDWGPQAFIGLTPGDPNVIYINHSQSNVGVTNGSNSLALELNTGTGWGTTLTASTADADPTLYNIFNTVAQDPNAWFIEGDLTLDASSWANVSKTNPAVPPFQEIGLFQVNFALSDDGGFGQTPATADLFDQQVNVPIRIRAADLMFVPDSSFYQLFLGGSGVFQTGGTAQAPLGAQWLISTICVSRLPHQARPLRCSLGRPLPMGMAPSLKAGRTVGLAAWLIHQMLIIRVLTFIAWSLRRQLRMAPMCCGSITRGKGILIYSRVLLSVGEPPSS